MTTMAMDSRAVPAELRNRSRRPADELGALGLDIDEYFWCLKAEDEVMWYEPKEAIVEGLRNGERKRHLLVWVRAVMADRLTQHERECVELFYFIGLNCRQIATLRGINKSTAYRNKERGIGRIRALWDARDCPACIIEAAMLYTGSQKESHHGGPATPFHHAQPNRGSISCLPPGES